MWSEVFGLIKTFISAIVNEKREKREKVSSLFHEISVVINHAADQIEQHEYPHYSCMVMHTLADNLKETLTGSISEDILDNFYTKLKSVSSLEREYGNLKEPNIIIQLREAAAEFKAFSMLLKI